MKLVGDKPTKQTSPAGPTQESTADQTKGRSLSSLLSLNPSAGSAGAGRPRKRDMFRRRIQSEGSRRTGPKTDSSGLANPPAVADIPVTPETDDSDEDAFDGEAGCSFQSVGPVTECCIEICLYGTHLSISMNMKIQLSTH